MPRVLTAALGLALAAWLAGSINRSITDIGRTLRSLAEHCAAVGRDPDEIERSVQVRVDYNDLVATASALQPLIDAGATHIILGLGYPYPEGIVARLAEEVVARVG